MLRVGDVVRFRYEQGCDNSERVAKVLKVRDLNLSPLAPATVANGKQIKRNRYLVTAKQSDGAIRSFYTDEIGIGLNAVGLVKRVLLYCMGVRF